MPEPSTVDRLSLLAARPILHGLSRGVLESLDEVLESVHVPGGTRVVRQGQTDVPLFLILSGGLSASTVGEDNVRRVLYECFRGSSMGEALMLCDRPSPVDVDAIRDSHLLRLDRDRFCALSKQHPELTLNVARVVAARAFDLVGSPEVLASFSEKADRLPRSMALLTVGGADVERIRHGVADALSSACVALRLTRPMVQEAIASKRVAGADLADHALTQWFDCLTARNDLVILECTLSDPTWLDFCLRQADRILVLLDPEETTSSRRGTDWWRAAKLGERSGHIELAVVHTRSSELPRASAAYAEWPGVARLHHVRAGEAASARRLARWLTDRPVGLVLGGGGCYGIAHVGVMKALEEAGVPVDIVGGTSMGAIFAAGLARGWPADRIMCHVRRIFASRFALYDPTIPFKSLLAGKKLDRMLRELFEDIAVRDLWIPFFCVATSIVHARPEIHERGLLRDAIRSSCSIPGLFPPFQTLKDLLVDGGIVDNLPIGVMSERCPGPVIAVDVFPYERPGRLGPQGLLSYALDWLKPSTNAGTPIFDTLLRATLTGSKRTTEESRTSRPPALYLTPRLDRFSILEWRAHQAIFQEGYDCAKRQLDAGALPRSLWEGPFEYRRASSD
jgi:predicted acylesterase/phospholipase RssA/CRP-like cAMP-binding protein